MEPTEVLSICQWAFFGGFFMMLVSMIGTDLIGLIVRLIRKK